MVDCIELFDQFRYSFAILAMFAPPPAAAAISSIAPRSSASTRWPHSANCFCKRCQYLIGVVASYDQQALLEVLLTQIHRLFEHPFDLIVG